MGRGPKLTQLCDFSRYSKETRGVCNGNEPFLENSHLSSSLVAFIHRKSIILQCRVVYVVRGGEMYGKSVGVNGRGEGPPKRWVSGGMKQRGDQLGVTKSAK